MLREEFGDLKRLRLESPVPQTVKYRLMQAALAVAAGDGEVSPREREVLLVYARRYGVRPEGVERLRTFEIGGRPIANFVDGQLLALARVLVYVGTKVARADALHKLERGALDEVTKRLLVEPELVRAVDALAIVENAVDGCRHRLLATPKPDGTGPVVDDGSVVRAHVYGPAAGEPLLRDHAIRFGKAVLVVAAGDGELTEPELAWFAGERRATGTPPDVVEELLKFDHAAARIDDVVDDRLRPHARAVLYAAVRTAAADGFAEREHALASRAASRLGLDASFVAALDNQIRAEDALRESRTSLLSPR